MSDTKPKFDPNAPFQVVKPPFDPNQPFEHVGTDNSPSQLESALRGATQGLTSGFSDEIAGGLGAGGSALLNLDPSLEHLKQKYQEFRDIERAKNEAAQKANPGTYLAGELGGGVAQGFALPNALSIGKNLSTLGKIGKATQIGALLGAASGLGESKADLTQGNTQGAVQDALSGAKIGALTGGGLQTGVETVSGLGKLTGKLLKKGLEMHPSTKVISRATEKGLEGKNLTDLQKPLEDLETTSKDLATKALGTRSHLSQEYDQILADSANKNINVNDFLKKLQGLKAKYSGIKDPQVQQEVAEIENTIRNYTEGLPTEVENRIPYTRLKLNKEVPSAYNKLTDLIGKEEEKARLAGESVKGTIVPSEDNKLLTPVFSGAENGVENNANVKLVKMIPPSDDLPLDEALRMSERQAFLLKEKMEEEARLLGENVKAKIVQTKNPEFPFAVLKTTSEEAIPKLKIGTPIPNTDAIPQHYTGTPAELIQKSIQRKGGSPDLKAQEIFDLQKLIGDKTANQLETFQGKQFGSSVDKALGEKAEQVIPELGDINKRYSAIKKSLGVLGLDDNDALIKNVKTGNLELSPQALGKIQQFVKANAEDSLSRNKAEQALNLVLDNMDAAGLNTDKLRKTIQETSENFQIAKDIAGKGLHTRLPLLNVKNMAYAGNLLGYGASKTTGAYEKIAPGLISAAAQQRARQEVDNKPSYYPNQASVSTDREVQQGKNVYATSNEDLSGVSQKLKSIPGMEYKADALANAIQKNDETQKNAIVFSLMQNPATRKLLEVDRVK